LRSIEPVGAQPAPRPVPLTQPLGSPQVRPARPAPQPVNELIAQAREFASTGGASYSSDVRISAEVRSEFEPAADVVLARREPAQALAAQAQQPPRPAPRKGMPGLLERVAQTGRFRSPGRPDEAEAAAAEASEPAAQRAAPPKPAQASTILSQQDEEDQLEIPAFLRRQAT